MNKVEAAAVADATLDRMRTASYGELVARLLDQVETDEVVGESGVSYQVEILAFWDSS